MCRILLGQISSFLTRSSCGLSLPSALEAGLSVKLAALNDFSWRSKLAAFVSEFDFEISLQCPSNLRGFCQFGNPQFVQKFRISAFLEKNSLQENRSSNGRRNLLPKCFSRPAAQLAPELQPFERSISGVRALIS